MGVSQNMGQQVLQPLGLGSAILLQDVLQRDDDIGVRDGGKRGRLGEVRQRAAACSGAEPTKASKSGAGTGIEAPGGGFALSPLHDLVGGVCEARRRAWARGRDALITALVTLALVRDEKCSEGHE